MKFTFEFIESEYVKIIEAGYSVLNCFDAIDHVEKTLDFPAKTLINRVDVDFSVTRARRLGDIFARHHIPATFFFRLHAREYNPLSFENLSIIRDLDAMGFEIGYHSEIVDGAEIWSESPGEVLRRDLEIMSAILGKPVKGIASHGGLTGLNNLDFWQSNSPKDFGITYEAYDKRIFETGIYVSDSEWTRWKSYRQGRRLEGATTSPAEYAAQGEKHIYVLIHSDTYFDRHIYES